MANEAPGGRQHGRTTIPVHEEQVRVSTRMVDTGRGVRVHKSVTEQPHVLDQVLMHDDILVEHVAIDMIVAADQAPATRYEGDTLVVPILEEVLVLEKRVRIKEEIRIVRSRRETHHAETVTLKSEQVQVEHFDESAAQQGPGGEPLPGPGSGRIHPLSRG
jgi:uncharacterized protein (TIGR02271 family)